MKNGNFKIVISFFCIWLTVYLSKEIQDISAFILILSFGILHGANDVVLINKIKTQKNGSSNLKFLLIYIGVILFTVLIFYFLPVIALLAFVLISAYHFGEQHWTGKVNIQSKILAYCFYFTYGFLILFMIFYFNQTEVIEIVWKLTNFKITPNFLQISFLISILLLGLQGFNLILKNIKFRRQIFLEFFYLLVFALIFQTTGLLWGFAIYFIFWHSLPSLMDQVAFLYGSWSSKNFLKYCKSAFWYWIISIFGIFILYYILKDGQLFEAMFFAFLAAITIPHVCVIIFMFKNKNSAEDKLL